MQPYNNDIPLFEPEDFDPKETEKAIRDMQNRFPESDEIRIMSADKAKQRKKQFREWRKSLKKQI